MFGGWSIWYCEIIIKVVGYTVSPDCLGWPVGNMSIRSKLLTLLAFATFVPGCPVMIFARVMTVSWSLTWWVQMQKTDWLVQAILVSRNKKKKEQQLRLILMFVGVAAIV